MRDCILLCACGESELLPQNPDLPADVFTSCLTTPIKVGWEKKKLKVYCVGSDMHVAALVWHTDFESAGRRVISAGRTALACSRQRALHRPVVWPA